MRVVRCGFPPISCSRTVRAAASRSSVMPTADTFHARTPLSAGGRTTSMFSLPALQAAGFDGVARLPYSLKILLENLLRHEDGRFVKAADVEALARWDTRRSPQKEISFTPARVLL